MLSLTKFLLFAAIAVVVLWFFSSVSGALMPFVLAAVFAYIVSPLAAKGEQRLNISSVVLAAALAVLFVILLVALPVALVPLIVAQLQDLAAFLFRLVEKLQTWLGRDIVEALGDGADILQKVDIGTAANAVGTVKSLFGGGLSALAGGISILLVTPLAVFYFLRDRQSIAGELTEVLPPKIRERALALMRDLDAILSEFLHAQLLVMLIMSVFYAAVLKLAGLEFAITIGVISGILVFVPYVGFILGISLATLVALGDFQSWLNIAIIWSLMIVGTVLESLIITPRLVGERIGLHPLVILLALFVMGELFGFVGVLLSLPMAAVLLVCLRHLRRYYIGSDFYR